MTTGFIFDIKRFSIHDGPGIRTTVFLKGCPLRCWWCHNPEGQAQRPELILLPDRCIGCAACCDVCEQGAIVLGEDDVATDREQCMVCGACVEVCYTGAREMAGRTMTVAEVMDEINRDAVFYDQSGGGVTFSGGEPLAQATFLLALLKACRARSIHTVVDTCGYAAWSVLEQIRHHVDLFLYDLKLMDDERHRAYTGVSNRRILSNLRCLLELGQAVILRLPLIPGVNDAVGEIRAIGEFAASLSHLTRVDVLPYHPIGVEKYRRLDRAYPLPETGPPSDAGLARARRILLEADLDVTVGGSCYDDE